MAEAYRFLRFELPSFSLFLYIVIFISPFIVTFEKQDYLEKVRLAFLEMKKYPNIFIIKGDEERTSLEIFQKIKELVEPIIKKKLDTKGEIIVCE